MTSTAAQFDSFASEYDAALAQGLSITGESKHYFARGRIVHLAARLAGMAFAAKRILDFGCGTGSATPYLFEHLGCDHVSGMDVSEASLEVARRENPEQTRFVSLADFRPDATFDLAFCNGVFHHIPLDQRAAAARSAFDALRPGGIFALWENNPWNPGTRWVMSRIPFDRDAVMLSPPRTRALLRDAGFTVLRTDFLFIFPRFLKVLRPLEGLVTTLPLGAQYLVLARKPGP